MSAMTKNLPAKPAADLHKPGPKGIPIEVIITYRKKGLTTQEIGTLLGCSHSAIVQRLRDYKGYIDNIGAIKQNKSDLLHIKQAQLLNHLTLDEIKKASAYQKVGMFGLLYDKARLEDNKSTSNVSYADMTARMQALDKQLEDMGKD